MGDWFRGNVIPSLIQHHVHQMNAGRQDVPMRIRGKVSSGLGRAHVFMAQTHYQEQFKQILGKTAWPGTLNVEVSGTDFVNQLHRELYSADFLSEESKLDLTEWMAEVDYRLVEGGGEQIQLDALTARLVSNLKQ